MNNRTRVASLIISATLLAFPALALASFDTNLHQGNSGPAVTAMQQFLAAQGDFSGSVTGYFGSITLAAVQSFQARMGISPASGFWGPLTRAAANNLATGGTASAGATTNASASGSSLLQSLYAEVAQLQTQIASMTGNASQPTGSSCPAGTSYQEACPTNAGTCTWGCYSNQTPAQGSTSGASASLPTVSLAVNGQQSANVPQGSSFTVTWSSSNAASCGMTNVINGVSNTNQTTANVSGSAMGTAPSGGIQYTFTCTNSAGQSASATAQVVTPGAQSQSGSASLSASPPSGNAPLTVTFKGGVNSFTNYTIDFGDGQSNTNVGCPSSAPLGQFPCPLSPVSHTYTQAGSYVARLIQVYHCGASDGGTCTPPPPATLGSATITVSGTSTSLPTVSLAINGQQSANVPQGSPFTVTWSSSNAASCVMTNVINGVSNTNQTTANVSGSAMGTAPSGGIQYTFTCTNSAGQSASATAQVVTPGAQSQSGSNSLTFNGGGTYEETVGVPYSNNGPIGPFALYGTPPYTYQIVAGALAPGVSLAGTTGPNSSPPYALVVTGTPTAAGWYAATIQVTDSKGATASGQIPISVSPAWTSQASGAFAPPSGIVGLPYAPYGGTVPNLVNSVPGSFTLSSGSLPPGLSLTGNSINESAITGTPTTPGAYNFTLHAGNPQTTQFDHSYTIYIAPAGTAAITPTTFPNATVGFTYGTRSAGGVTPLVWQVGPSLIPATGSLAGYPSGPCSNCEVTSGSLPPGITIADGPSEDHGFIGTPTTPGAYTFSMNGQLFAITVSQPLTLGPASLPVATVGIPYNMQLTCSGEHGACTYFGPTGGGLFEGNFPTWLTCQGKDGACYGTPPAGSAGTYTFNVAAFSNAGTLGQQTYTLTVQ